MQSSDARVGEADPSPHRARVLRSALERTSRRVAEVPPRALLVALACIQWLLVVAVAVAIGRDGSLWIVVPQVLVLMPLLLLLIYETARRLGGPLFAAWAAFVWIALPYAGLAYANPSLRHGYAHQFLPRVLGLADDPRFLAMVAFLAAIFFTMRALETGASVDVAIAVVTAALGAAFAPRAALVALVPAVGLAVGGSKRHAIAAAAALAVLLACVGIAVDTGLLATPFAHLETRGPANTLASLSENFWSGRVLEWLAIAGVAGALRGRRPVGAMIGVALVATLFSLQTGPTPLESNLALLHALVPVWAAVALAIASIPLLVPRKQTAGGPQARTEAESLAP
jgi:hypothetical protein